MATSIHHAVQRPRLVESENVDYEESEEGDFSSDEESVDSDAELQKAFVRGELKPGLNVVAQGLKKKIDDVIGINEALVEFKQNLSWIERLDIVTDEVHKFGTDDKEEEEQMKKTPGSADDVHNDFKREMKFYRQGQAAVLEAIPRLQRLGLATRRPEDYFAEMAKSDEHMRKVRKKLINRQLSVERSEKAKKLRELKKYGKKVQHEVLLKRQREKKELMESVKKFRRGKKDALDILEDLDRKPGSSKTANKMNKKGAANDNAVNSGKGNRRQYRDAKFGEGGKKRGSKRNTKESTYDEMSSKRNRNQGPDIFKPGKKYQVERKKQMKRLGKARRQKVKSKRKK